MSGQTSGACVSALFNLEGTNSGEIFGGIVQLVEHLLCKQGVIGSSPIISTNESLKAKSKPSEASLIWRGGAAKRLSFCRRRKRRIRSLRR